MKSVRPTITDAAKRRNAGHNPSLLRRRPLLLTPIACVCLLAQPEAPIADLPSFEVASVKQSRPISDGMSFSDVKIAGPRRFVAINASLDECIRWAYGLNEYQIVEPEWMHSKSYNVDIEALAPVGATGESIRLMAQRLLRERFSVVVHREKKTMSVYALRTAGSGPRLHKASDAQARMTTFSRGSITSPATSMGRLAAGLSRELGQPVLDETGLSGLFVVELSYAPVHVDDADRPSIFTAVREQLGLELRPVKAGIEILVVDSANKIPAPN